MEDMERYGDYNDYEDDRPPRRSLTVTVIKVLLALVCLLVVGVIVFRMILFEYYPKKIKSIYFTDALTAYYEAAGGNVGAKTQKLRYSYDDPDTAHFIADNLIVITDIGELQVSARYNVSLMKSLKSEFGIEADTDDTSLFTFTLARNPRAEGEEPIEIGSLSVAEFESVLLYRYYKLVFDGIDFGLQEGEEPVKWIRLEIRVNGVDMEQPYMIPIYENNEDYSTFEDYEFSKEEKPK